MPKYKIRLVLDETFEVEAADEEEALEEAWNVMFEQGAYGTEVNEIEEDSDEDI